MDEDEYEELLEQDRKYQEICDLEFNQPSIGDDW